TALSNGNYAVRSPGFSGGLGAVTLCSGTAATVAVVNAANSLTGSVATDLVGNDGVVALTNGNYVVVSKHWTNGAFANAGAGTFGTGTAGLGVIGPVSAFNSLVGGAAGDSVGSGGVVALTGGAYVVSSPLVGGSVGAATFGNGVGGVTGTVSPANS